MSALSNITVWEETIETEADECSPDSRSSAERP